MTDLKEMIDPLTAWYRANKRDLPWRREVTPYRVWISEIMLQQTRVEAVKDYFLRFTQALPDAAALAARLSPPFSVVLETFSTGDRID